MKIFNAYTNLMSLAAAQDIELPVYMAAQLHLMRLPVVPGKGLAPGQRAAFNLCVRSMTDAIAALVIQYGQLVLSRPEKPADARKCRGSVKRGKQDWTTPKELFSELNQIFAFELDAAASPDNALCAEYLTEEDDALSKPWNGRTAFVNPPFGDLGEWLSKARKEADNGSTVVLLVPHRSQRSYWHEHVLNHNCSTAYAFKKGITFGDNSQPFPYPCCLVVMWQDGRKFPTGTEARLRALGLSPSCRTSLPEG